MTIFYKVKAEVVGWRFVKRIAFIEKMVERRMEKEKMKMKAKKAIVFGYKHFRKATQNSH